MTTSFLLLLFSALAPLALAQSAGYVVKIESGTAYLDLASSATVVGQEFVIYTEGEKLKHPVTGAVLGSIEKTLARGRIQEIKPQYCVGQVLSRDANAELRPGQKYKLLSSPPAATTPADQGMTRTPASEKEQTQGPLRHPFWRSPGVDLEAVDMAVGDLLGDGRAEIVMADERRVQAFPNGSEAWKPVCSYEEKGTGVKIVSVDSLDLDKNGKAEVFVSYYNSFFNRVETAVLECRDGAFVKLASLPWLTRAYQDSGTWKLASQQLVGDRTFPFANIYPLEFNNGKYAQSGTRLNLKRIEWSYGFAVARDPNITDPIPLSYTNTSSIRIQFKKGGWSTPDSYGQTASRVRWYDRLMMFHPRILLTQDNEAFSGAYTLRNNPGIGGLAGSFGYYMSSELHRLKWTGMSLEPLWKAELGGYAADIALAKGDAEHPEELLVAVVGKAGRTSVWKFVP